MKKITIKGHEEGVLTNSALMIGSFDGVHLGHKAIADTLIALSRQKGLKPYALTFEPHPRLVLGNNIKLLTTHYEKFMLLSKLELDGVVYVDFNRQIADMSYADFVEQFIVKALGAKLVVVGYDHHFGRGREGNPERLVEFGKLMGFDVKVVQPIKLGEKTIKSNTIRELVEYGDIAEANAMLGHLYLISGITVKGKGLGEQIGYPTANIEVPEEKLLPLNGVYAAMVGFNDNFPDMPAVVYVGTAPTVSGKKKMVEVHIFDFEGKLYGTRLNIGLVDFIRVEREFRSTEVLRAQIENDIEIAKQIINRHTKKEPAHKTI